MDPSAIALQGLQQAEAQIEAAATAIAKAGAASPDGASLDVVDLSTEMVALSSARNVFEVNLATLKTADQMQRSLVDIKA
jgi:flagellar hook protein FlgE